MTMRRVCVFCGSAAGARPAYRRAAARLGEVLARRGLGLVYGGGSIGLMGVLADAALAAGGEVVGVIPRRLARKEIAHAGLKRLYVVPSMHARKARMADLADAFVAMPGGMGTLEELTEVLTWAQLGLHAKPCALLDVAGYWRPLIRLLDHAVEERFLRPEHRRLLLVERGPERLLDRLGRWRPPPHRRRWIDRRGT
ncbi:MAG TPA: TIGR00730 family Rossman fold protein [Anaeromyxobacteraceae bacterium]|nr:TIGR00730 family Rossman fold protein [Anaeromyxobacteraceae bacterium]